MRILYITCGSGSDPTLGGSLVRTLEIAKRAKERHKIYFLTTTGGKVAIGGCVYEIKTPLSTHQMDRWFIWRQLYSYLCVFVQSFSIDLPDCDLVYLDSDGLWDIIPALIYKLKHPDTKLISMNHHLSTGINMVHQWISHILIRRWADVVFVLDTPAGEEIKNLIRHPKTYSVWNGIDLETIKSIPEQEKKYDACFFGVLRPGKGLHIIVDIWNEVCQVKPESRLLIIGDILPHYKKYLMQEIYDYELEDNIEIMGYVQDQKEAFRLVKQSKIFISPALEEGWGITTMECIALGLWGVVWDLPTYKNILKEGVVKVEKGNIPLFSEQVIKLLGWKSYPEVNLSKFDWDKMAEKEMGIYDSLFCNQ